MKLESKKEFPYSMETAWAALHSPAKLDVNPGAQVREISDTEWETHDTETGVVTTYTASYDESGKVLTIEGAGDGKSGHDFIYLTLDQVDPDRVSLEILIEINTGVHLIAKALGALFAKPMKDIMCKHIFHNFSALCEGKETKQMSHDELKDIAKKTFEK